MEFPEDMIEELLLRLPLKSIIKFKCVSRDWNNLISTSKFHSCYRSRRLNICPIGFVYYPIKPSKEKFIPDIGRAKFVCTSNGNIDKAELGLCHDLHPFGDIIGSSKGLVLLCHSYKRYHVYDPLTRKHASLPKILEECAFAVTGFICKEREQSYANNINNNGSYLTYKVVRIATNVFEEKKTTYEVQTYSSETGKWHTSTMTTASLEFFFFPQRAATVIRGVLYWWNMYCQYIIAFDPEDPFGRGKLIEIPKTHRSQMLTISNTQDGRLLCLRELVLVDTHDVWVLERSYEKGRYLEHDIINRSRWTLLHTVSNVEIRKSLLDFRPSGPASLQLVGFHHKDSTVIYLRMGDKFISYNSKEKRVETITFVEEEEECVNWMNSYVYFEWPSWPCLQ